MILLPNSKKAHKYEGNMTILPTEGGGIAVLEEMPNVTGIGEATTKKVRSIYSPIGYTQAVLGEDTNEVPPDE